MSGLQLEVHTIIAVQFTEARAVAEAQVGAGDSWVPIARGVALLNNATVSKKHWEYFVYRLDMGDHFDLHLLPLGDVEIRVTISLHGRLGNTTVGTLTQIIPVRIIEGYVPDVNVFDFQIFDDDDAHDPEDTIDNANNGHGDDEYEDDEDDGDDEEYGDENDDSTYLEALEEYTNDVDEQDYFDELDGYETP
ncbi:hypothetical protein SEPCBS57363_005242 [Sporothrix epigloea]|uniref:FHA domain-containing protein n=1 Tax=Sporothrix epigloea TaxID=1892477 RepID=A0ABP0DWH5_9PEZI